MCGVFAEEVVTPSHHLRYVSQPQSDIQLGSRLVHDHIVMTCDEGPILWHCCQIFFSTSQLFILDLDLYGLRCIMGSTFSNYLLLGLSRSRAQECQECQQKESWQAFQMGLNHGHMSADASKSHTRTRAIWEIRAFTTSCVCTIPYIYYYSM